MNTDSALQTTVSAPVFNRRLPLVADEWFS
jgi:hypothetical protein